MAAAKAVPKQVNIRQLQMLAELCMLVKRVQKYRPAAVYRQPVCPS